jgi:threonine/homoserine/homoserine lactone efflux protein
VIGYLLTGLSLGFYAAISPGPFQAFLLSQALKNGWRRTLPASLAPLLTDGPIVALVLVVLTQTPDWFLNLLRIIGGLFILYLAKGAFSLVKTSDFTLELSSEPAQQSFLKAVVMNGLNPNPYIFWSLIAGPIFLEGWRQAPRLGFSFVLGFYGTLIGGFAGFVILFATARHLGSRVTKILSLVSAIALLVFGSYQIGEGLRNIIG